MFDKTFSRRQFAKSCLLAAAAAPLSQTEVLSKMISKPQYRGPNVIIIRYGGGVRRQETIITEKTHSPYMMKVLADKATLFSNMEISNMQDIETSHAQGTAYIITGRYHAYENLSNKPVGEILQPNVPTLFEYFRKHYDIDVHETLIINGENRLEDESLNFGTHHMFGVQYRSEILSYNKYKAYLYQTKLEEGGMDEEQEKKIRQELDDMLQKSLELVDPKKYPKRIQKFWNKWRAFYGDTGLLNPRGDRLSTEISLWAMKYLRPKLMMINYQDPDYVHWGIKSQYTRGISIIDHGIRQIVNAVENDDFYRDNTVFVIVPDCGRDSNPLMDIPYQHHFNTQSSREIFAMMFGTGVQKGRVIDKTVDQISITKTIGEIMGFKTSEAEGELLREAFI